jgi:hypothetical protein
MKAEVGNELMAVMQAFLETEGDEWAAEKMERLAAVVGKIVVNKKAAEGSKSKGKGKGKGKVTKTADMSERCQGCEWKGGKIQNGWCKKGGEHTFEVGGETVKCCEKHFEEWEKADDTENRLKGRVGFALAKAHNRRGSVRFMGFFGVSATNPARRPPIFPGEHYATISGTPDWASFTKKSGDNAMDAASEEPEGKNGKYTGGVYMPSGGWEGAAESVKLDKDVYNLTSKSDTTEDLTEDLTEDTEQVDETRGQTDETRGQTDDAPKQTDDAPKQTDDAPKQTDDGKRKSVEYHGEKIYLTRDQSGDVYVSEDIVKWVKEDEQVNNPDFKGLLAEVKKSWGKYNKTSNSIEWNDGVYQEAVDTFMDMGDGTADDDTADDGW